MSINTRGGGVVPCIWLGTVVVTPVTDDRVCTYFLLSLCLFFIGENLDQFLVPETADNTVVVESPGITDRYTILCRGVHRTRVCVCLAG